jgi:hypothetical protein
VSNDKSPRCFRDEPGDHALGRSRGGLSTMIHAAVDGRGGPLAILLTPGQAGDAPMMLPLLAQLRVQRTIGRPGTRPGTSLCVSTPTTRPSAPSHVLPVPRPRRDPYRPDGTLTARVAATRLSGHTAIRRRVPVWTGRSDGLCGLIDDALDLAAVDVEFAGYSALAVTGVVPGP